MIWNRWKAYCLKPICPVLFILPAGTYTPSPSEALTSTGFDELIEQLKKDFDFVILDSPSVLATPDPTILAPRIDTALLVVRSGKIVKDDLLSTLDHFRQTGDRSTPPYSTAFPPRNGSLCPVRLRAIVLLRIQAGDKLVLTGCYPGNDSYPLTYRAIYDRHSSPFFRITGHRFGASSNPAAQESAPPDAGSPVLGIGKPVPQRHANPGHRVLSRASILVGIGKEWMDGMGFGNVDFTDFLADIAGVATAVYFLAGHARENNQVRRRVTFRSQATSKDIEPDLIIPPPKWDDPTEKR
jgi:hypothetical protein